MPPRLCSECDTPLDGSTRARTCSDSCRGKRSRRLRAANSDENRELKDRARSEIPDVARDLIRDELKPIVREALTTETLAAIQDLIGLTPRAVEQIAGDLESEDAAIRQKAYSLIARYTFGNPAVVGPKDEDEKQTLNVNFNLPRAGDTVEHVDVIEETSEETKECDTCHADKRVQDFISGSDRCNECFQESQSKAQELLERLTSAN